MYLLYRLKFRPIYIFSYLYMFIQNIQYTDYYSRSVYASLSLKLTF
jgi:hypothetical protein